MYHMLTTVHASPKINRLECFFFLKCLFCRFFSSSLFQVLDAAAIDKRQKQTVEETRDMLGVSFEYACILLQHYRLLF